MIYKKIDISKAAFYNVSEDAAKEFVDHRINIKKPLTQRAFERAMKKTIECGRYGFTPDDAVEMTIDAGWQGITPEYLAANQSRRMQAAQEARTIGSTQRASLLENLTDRSWAN